MEQGDPEEIVNAAKREDVHEMILRLPEGYDTEFGPQGTVLSGGQRQRIALARAIHGRPKLVVLDEPNANLDQQGEAAPVEVIGRLKNEGVTVVLVAHRLPAFPHITKLLLLDNGQVADFGLRDDVVSRARAKPGPTDVGNKGKPQIKGTSGKFIYGGSR